MESNSTKPVSVRSEAVQPPDLRALKRDDETAWNAVVDWLWPTVFAVARSELQQRLPHKIEDAVMETMEELGQKVHGVKSVEELKPLAASIAHNRAVSVLRWWFAQKRGADKTDSFDALKDDEKSKYEPVFEKTPLDSLTEKELASRLRKSLAELKSPLGEILSDSFLDGLKHEEIAQKRGVNVKSVGGYLARGLKALRQIWRRGEKS